MSVTITGNINDLTGTAVTSNCYVRFWLRGCNGNQPRVGGAALIAPDNGPTYWQDFAPNGSGQISGTLYSNDVNISAGGQVGVTWYDVQVFLNGQGGAYTPYALADGTTFNLNSAAPITTNPVVAAPTGDSTYARLDAGNTPFTGIIQFLQGILLALGKSIAWSTDLFLGRGAAGKLTVGTTAGASDGTVSAATYQVGGVSQSGTGPLVGQTNATLTTPTLNSPSLVTPVLGVATATSVNKVTITQPVTGATLTILDGKTAKVDNTLELAGTDGVKHTFPATAPTGGVLAYGVPKFQQFSASGTFTIPTGVTGVKVIVVGGGGAGGGATAANNGGGGGSGGYAEKLLTGLTPGNTITVTVGTGGAGSAGANGAAGVASSIASGTQTIATVTANGGSGGQTQAGNVATPGIGAAISTGGDINGFGVNGFFTATAQIGGAGGSTFLGGGGLGGANSIGSAGGTNSGSGGGGAGGPGSSLAGGAGAAGTVIFAWFN